MSDFKIEDNKRKSAADAIGSDQRYVPEKQTINQPEKQSEGEDNIHDQGKVLGMPALDCFDDLWHEGCRGTDSCSQAQHRQSVNVFHLFHLSCHASDGFSAVRISEIKG